MTTKLKSVPLNKLFLDTANVRQAHDDRTIKTLAENIAVSGLQQSLLVRESKTGFGVIAGGRRLLALQLLRDEKRLAANFAVPVLIFSGSDEEARAASLTENTQRENMSDAEQIVAFGKIHNKGQGLTVEDIASRYRIGVRRVRATLAMSDLPDEVIAMLQDKKISLERLEALANCKCQERVAEAIKRMDDFCGDHNFKQFLTENEVTGESRLARFVGLDAYKTAGGTTREDLFTTDEEIIFENLSVLKTLADKKLQAVADEYTKDGWANVKLFLVDDDAPYPYSWEELDPEKKETSKKDQKTILTLTETLQKLGDQRHDAEEAENDEEVDQLEEEIEKLEKKIKTIEATYYYYTDEQKNNARVEISLNSASDSCIFIRQPARQHNSTTSNTEKPKKPDYTKAVMGDLLDIKTLSLQGAVAQDTKVAKILFIASALNMVENSYGDLAAIKLRNENKRSFLDHTDNSAANICNELFNALQEKHKLQTSNTSELISTLMSVEHDDLDQILAIILASQINLNAWAAEPKEVSGSQELCDLVSLDITTVYEIDEAILKRMSRPVIEEAVKEAGNKDQHKTVTACKTKKDVVALALPILKEFGWLPPALRTEHYRESKSTTSLKAVA